MVWPSFLQESANDDDLYHGQALGFLSEVHLHNVIDGKERPLIAAKIRCARETAIRKCHDCDCQWIAVQVIHGAKHCRRDPPSEAGRRNLRVGNEPNKNVPAARQQPYRQS